MKTKLYKIPALSALWILLFTFTSYAQEELYPDREFRVAINTGDITVYIQENGSLSVKYPKRNKGIDVDYYDHFDNKAKEGKIKKWGNITFDYYDSFDASELQGKIKRINTRQIEYYDRFDQDELKGKVKSVGNIQIKYYDRYDNGELTGKIKSVGALKIEYFDSYASNGKRGLIKSVSGSTNTVYLDFRF